MRTIDDLKIKDKLIIFNREYSIEYPLKVDGAGIEKNDNEYFTGMAFFQDQKIQLLSDSHPEAQLRTLFHEMSHIAFHEVVGGADTIDLEVACDAVSALLYDMCHNFEIKYRGEK